MPAKDVKANQPNREELINMAETAAKRGQKEPARMMFRRVLEQDPRNEKALMWLARLSKTKRERKQWLERVLVINPDNELAQSQLNKMSYQSEVKENRALVLYGTIAAVLIVTTVIVVVAIIVLR